MDRYKRKQQGRSNLHVLTLYKGGCGLREQILSRLRLAHDGRGRADGDGEIGGAA